ncbi:MFS transporter [Brachybacterium sp. NPDC056505]|uniref:MFS transporter n=1 Tax=Brachybacterium sp. NPDC056505 TaxID=3345843 RepID=UPI003670521E
MTCSTHDRRDVTEPLEPRAEAEPRVSGRRALITALALSTGTAALVGSEFVPAGVLPQMASDLRVTEGRAGLAVAATALAGAFTAPTIAAILPRAERRAVLLALLALATVSNLVVVVAPGLPLVLLARVLLGIAIAGYWSFTFSIGVRVTGRPALISTALALGTSAATIVGVPLASVLGDLVGWRAVFAIIAAVSVLSALVLRAVLPPVPALPGAGIAMMKQVLRSRLLMAGIVGVGLAALANFTAYPYIRLAIAEVAPASVAMILLAWGIGGLVGNIAGGYLSRWLRWATAAAPAILAVSLCTVASADHAPLLVLGTVAWGVGFNMIPVTTQLWVTAVEPHRAEAAVSLQVTAFQTAITVGAVLGGALVDGAGYPAALRLGAVAAVLAALVFTVLPVRPRID